MFIKLDENVERLLCCSLCKSDLVKYTERFVCNSCGLKFPKRAVKTDKSTEEFVFDFRLHHPPYCVPQGLESWADAQSEYEQYRESRARSDSLQAYLDEIDSVREIYTTEHHIEGKVLDVGGHQGRLRHYLGRDVSLYVSADPYISVFSGVGQQPNLLRAYPCLSEPCNFVSAHAEHLPFKSNSFDWIHMRSVVDHFADPYLAFLDAYRCSRVGGKLLVGLAIVEKLAKQAKSVSLADRMADKLKMDGLPGLFRAVLRRFGCLKTRGKVPRHTDDHMFRLTYDSLMDLFLRTGWRLIAEHWQKAPFQHCIYTCGQKTGTVPTLARE